MPFLALFGGGGSLLVQWSYASADAIPFRMWGMVSVLSAILLALWVVLRRMKDTGGWLLWLLAISVGGRLAQGAVRVAGGSRDQADTALGLVLVLVLLGLGCAPSRPAKAQNLDVDTGASL